MEITSQLEMVKNLVQSDRSAKTLRRCIKLLDSIMKQDCPKEIYNTCFLLKVRWYSELKPRGL